MRPNQKKLQLRIVLLAAAGILLVVGLYMGGRWLEEKEKRPEVRGDHLLRQSYVPTVEYNGETYRQRQNLTSILLMGIDRASTAEGSGYRNGGQADFLRLMVIDPNRKLVSQLQIDRDTMTPITILGVLGNKSGVRTAQVSLSHGYGDGGEQSCELTVEAVTNLLFGAPIDFYMAMNLDGISELNDLVGGVTVTLEDDFTAIDPTMTLGRTMTLHGDQAETYVRNRHDVNVGTNEARMIRQEQYIAQLMDLFMAAQQQNENFVGEVFDALSPYLTTSISRGRLINEVWAAKDYEMAAAVKPQGVHQVADDGFMQFQVDEADLEQIVLDMFYEKVK